jgi:hypothetical protein
VNRCTEAKFGTAINHGHTSCTIFMLFDEASDGSKFWGYVGTKADSLS